MRNLLVYTLFAVALWYLGRAAMRRYLGPTQQNNINKGKGDSAPSHNREGNYDSARDVRYRELE